MANLHLIGNAHLDPVWLWRWQDGFSEVFATWRSALDRMNDFPDFKFTSACAVYYQWVEKIDPAMFAEIQQRVKEGRWNIVGGWFLQPDCNIPDGESFARQGLISQRYFKEKFGVTAKTGYNVDSFGHNAALPQILRRSGMENYVFLRPKPEESEFQGHAFQWESADGSRVCTYRIPLRYNITLLKVDLIKTLRDMVDEENRDHMAFIGVGNHGGGPTIELIHAINEFHIPNAVYSTPDEFFDGLDRENLPVLADELQHHARGCYSVCTFVKAANRKCEHALLAAEKFCVMAQKLIGAKYPKKKLDRAWRALLFNQFHDILAGCAIEKAYEDAAYQFGEVMSIAEQEINLALQGMSHRIDTLRNETLPAYKVPFNRRVWSHANLGTPIVVFNPHAWTVRMPVELYMRAQKVTDDRDNEIPFQIVRGDQTNADDKYHTAFVAEVPPMGYAVYRGFIEKVSEVEFEKELSCENNVLENACIRVEFDKATGDIRKFLDKRTGKCIIDRPCKAVLLDETDADTWAHDKVSLGDTVGMFDTPEFRLIEDGHIRTTLRVVTRCGNSTLRRDYTVTPSSPVLQVKTKVDFHEKHRALKFAFPLEGEEVVAKIPYGTIRRQKGKGEEPCGSWFAAGGLCVANDCKYGYDTTEDEVRLTVLRSAIWADHYGERDEFCEYMEQGIHEFTYAVFPYESAADAERRAEELNFRLRVVVDSFHKGDLPERDGCFTCDSDNIVVTAIKQSEDCAEPIVRFCEMNGENGTVSLRLFDCNLTVDVAHHEIRTFRTDSKELNLIEW